MRKRISHVIPQMFDIKPTNSAGDLDLEKLGKFQRVVKMTAKKKKKIVVENPKKLFCPDIAGSVSVKLNLRETRIGLLESQRREKKKEERKEKLAQFLQELQASEKIIPQKKVVAGQNNFSKFVKTEEERLEQESSVSQMKKCFSQYRFNKDRKRKTHFWDGWKLIWQQRPALSFALALFFLAGSFFLVRTGFYGWQAKKEIAIKGKNAVGLAAQAQTDFKERDFSAGLKNLNMAQKQLEEASGQLEASGGNILGKIPFFSMIDDGKKVLSGGQKTLEAAQLIGQAALVLYGQKEDSTENKNISLKEVFEKANENISSASGLLSSAKTDFEEVDGENLPKEYQGYFENAKTALTLGSEIALQFEKNYQVFWQIAGFGGPKKYLFLFQNNQEIRATGGFIGSYGVLELKDGEISTFYIDDIFNPDGQLKEKVVPPAPIQKISAAWSLHDSNWFPSFPVSAEKAGWFFEKTGGPTVDGVIALTPELLLKILAITGPVEMPEYGTTVDKDNFVEKTQYEVEVDYDKELNRPKKFIADLAPKILNRLFSSQPEKNFLALVGALNQSLKEKHILLYSFDYNAQKLISDLGWSGEVLNSDKDYLMVVNSNINGFKTDGVVDETISHKAEIQNDGSIINTVKISRHHNGGSTGLEWWDKVNSDYMRIYVPKGSQLLSVNGQTREFNIPPLDYDKLGFRRDSQVQTEELSMKVDEESGTRIYEENNKTVFANWVYVSPQETAEIEYQYRLPFQLDLSSTEGIVSYALLAQKQSGSVGSKFLSDIFFSGDKKVVWKYPETAEILLDKVSFSSDLKEDRFWAIVVKKE